MDFCIATFCFGERYYKQVNRLINSFEGIKEEPIIVVVTDKPQAIDQKWYTRVFDISEFNNDYKHYSNSYYTFDFSVKRYSILAAYTLGFTKMILTDADSVVNKNTFSNNNAQKGFETNSILGQTTYNFSKEVDSGSRLGQRFLFYEKFFNKHFDKNVLDAMPEDCVNFINIDSNKLENFLNTWNECIKIKYTNGLPNVPAGNIDEMCFSALCNGIIVGNNSNKIINLLTPIHDKWY